MNNQLIYSVLQYKHSPILGEVVNVGVLFYFPNEKRKLHLHVTDATRIRPIYKDFDARYFNAILKLIKSNIEKYSGDIYAEKLLNDNLKEFIHSYLLKSDDTALQFSELHTAINIHSSVDKAVQEYTRLLLPLTSTNEAKTVKHNEAFIIRKFKTKLFAHKEIENRVVRNYSVKTDEVSLKFDIAWQNGSLNLVHPLSFDLLDQQSIQRKTAEYCTYLSWLNNYTKEKNCRIDLLLAKPQESNLVGVYQKSIKLLESVQSNKKVVPFDEIDEYADNAVNYLSSI